MTIADASRRSGVSADTLRYYERVGIIPPVRRTRGGLRDYSEEDCGWIELAKCMRAAGLPVEALVEYTRLTRQGEGTLCARRQLLIDQRALLKRRLEAVQSALKRLDFKISRYDRAVKTGTLNWDE